MPAAASQKGQEPRVTGRPGPRAEYDRLLGERRIGALRAARNDLRISGARFGVVLLTVLVAWLSLGAGAVSPWWLAAPAAMFLGLAILHERVIRERRRLEAATAYYQKCIARLDHDWAGRGNPGERFLEDGHIYAADLDLFGTGSLFELICAARTRAGEDTLAAWLRMPSPPAEARERQRAIDELRGRVDLREDLALLTPEVKAGVESAMLPVWGAAPPVLASRALPVVAAALGVLALVTLGAWLAGLTGPVPFAVVALVEGIVFWRVRRPVGHLLAQADGAARGLDLLALVLARLERERFASPRLAALREALDVAGVPPSRRIASLHRLVELLDWSRNQLFAPIAFLLMWRILVALAIERWRALSGSAIARWLAAVGEIEALASVAGYAFEHPADPFPELVDGPEPLFDAVGLGHPLIPEERCVRNDLRLGAGPRLLIVSGSNMSGKSTLLRAVGANVVLALAGGPVRAARVRLSPLAPGASIRVLDSLRAGTSRFYAEITRLRQIVELAAVSPPALFLIDEMLHGTNSHDRRIGAEAVVKGLVERGAVGIVTTHDLALSRIAEALAAGVAANVHFEDHLEDGRMTFDYVMRPGVVQKSNALALMRAVGLEV